MSSSLGIGESDFSDPFRRGRRVEVRCPVGVVGNGSEDVGFALGGRVDLGTARSGRCREGLFVQLIV